MVDKTQDENYEDLFNQMYGNTKADEKQVEETDTEQEQEVEQQEQEEEKETDTTTKEPDPPKQEAKEEEYSDLIDKVSDENLKKQIQHLVQSERSQRGRVSALTKKNQKLEEMHQNSLRYREEEPRTQEKPKSESQDSASTAEDKGREKDLDMPPEVVAIKDKHPAVYNAFKKLSEMESSRAVEQVKADILKELDSRIKPVEDRYEEDAMSQEAKRFEAMASDVLDTEKSNTTVKDVITSEEFAKWIRGQSPRIQSFYKNASTADDGILVLTKFVADTNYIKNLDKQINEPEQEKPQTSKGDELKEKRQARKRASVGTNNASAVTSGDGDGDYDSIFNSYWGESGAYRTRRRTV